jgi:hypothetical protein
MHVSNIILCRKIVGAKKKHLALYMICIFIGLSEPVLAACTPPANITIVDVHINLHDVPKLVLQKINQCFRLFYQTSDERITGDRKIAISNVCWHLKMTMRAAQKIAKNDRKNLK